MRPTDAGVAIDIEQLDADPYPIYTRLRAEAPVCFVPGLDMWLVTRYDDVELVANDANKFVMDARESPLTRTIGTTMATIDGAPHARVRAAFAPAVTVATRGLDQRIAAITDELIASIASLGSGELMEELIVPISVAVTAEALGLGASDSETLQRWCADLTRGAFAEVGDPSTQAAADTASREVSAFMLALVERHAAPPGSLLGHLAESALSTDELVANLKLVMLDPAGFVGLTLWAMLAHPAELAAVRAQPSVLSRAVDEALRWQSPEGAQIRLVHRSSVVGGVEIPAQATVAAIIASANRDERRFVDADRFIIDRPERHAAFGFGPHSCPGAGIARIQLRTIIERLLTGLPALRLDPDRPAEIRGWIGRAPVTLHGRWDV